MSKEKEQLDEAATLNISREVDGVTRNDTFTTSDLDSLSDILRLAGIDGTMQVSSATLNVSSDSPPGSVGLPAYAGMASSSDMAKIMAMIDRPAVAQAIEEPECACDAVIEPCPVCGMEVCECDGMMAEEQAEYDYGKNVTSRKGYETEQPYDLKGGAELPDRITNRSGDNGMVRHPVVENKTFLDYLKEAEEGRASKTPRFLVTFEQVQRGYWGETTLKTKDVVIQAADEDEATRIAYSKAMNMPRQTLRNGDHKGWSVKGVQHLTGKTKPVEEAAEKPYFVLAELQDGKWVLAFGDYDKETVKYEADDMVDHGVKRKHLKVLKTGDSQAAVTHAIEALNSGAMVEEEALDEAPNYNRYGPPLFLLPTHDNETLDELEHNQYFGDALSKGESDIVVVGKLNGSSGKFTPRYCSTFSGVDHYKPGQEVTIVHDQTGGLTAGKVLYTFTGKEYMDPQGREKIKHDLDALGVSPRKKVPVKVFK